MEHPVASASLPVVFFDLDGTLLENHEHFPTVFARVLGELGIERTGRDVVAALGERWIWYEENVAAHRGDERAFWNGFNTEVCAAVGAGERAAEAGRRVTEAFGELDRPTLYDDVLPCLDALEAAGCRLGVITARPDARRVLEPLGVVDRFGWLVDAFASGSAKQDPRPYRLALELAGVDATRAIHVGDQYDKDVLPARAVGLRAVLLDRAAEHSDTDGERITTLAQLPGLLG